MPKKPPAIGRSTSSGDRAVTDWRYFTAEELEVAGILVQLPDLVHKAEVKSRLEAVWGAKKKRSAISSTSPASASPEIRPVNEKQEYVSNSPTSPLDILTQTDFESKHAVPEKKIKPTEFKDDPLELKLFNVSEPLDPTAVEAHRHQEPALGMLPSGIPDLNASPMEYTAALGFSNLPENESHHHRMAAGAQRSRKVDAAMARKRRQVIQNSKKEARVRIR